MRRANCCRAVAFVVSILMSQSASADELSAPVTVETRVTSPAVVTTWFRSGRQVDLIVLWRGTPHWFTRGHTSGASNGLSNGVVTANAAFGGIDLHVAFDPVRRTVRVQGKDVTLPESMNVVLVDGVDKGPQEQTLEVLSVDPQLPDGADGFHGVLRRSPQILAFLRCDVKLPEAQRQAIYDHLCAQATGK